MVPVDPILPVFWLGMAHLYVRAPGPGAIIGLVERFSHPNVCNVSVTPADYKTGFRCVMVADCNTDSLAIYLATSLRDIVYTINCTAHQMHIACFFPDGNVDKNLIVEHALHRIPLVRYFQIKKLLEQLHLPLWLLKLQKLKSVSYDTVQVLDQRDLLVEPGDVVYTTQVNNPD